MKNCIIRGFRWRKKYQVEVKFSLGSTSPISRSYSVWLDQGSSDGQNTCRKKWKRGAHKPSLAKSPEFESPLGQRRRGSTSWFKVFCSRGIKFKTLQPRCPAMEVFVQGCDQRASRFSKVDGASTSQCHSDLANG